MRHPSLKTVGFTTLLAASITSACADETPPDAANEEHIGGAIPAPCTEVAPTSLNGLEVDNTNAPPGGAYGTYRAFTWGLGTGFDWFLLEFYRLPDRDGQLTGTFDLSESPTYAGCSRCVRIIDDFDSPSATEFFQSSGTLVVHEASDHLNPDAPFLRAELFDVTLTERTTVDGLPGTLVEGGRCLHIEYAAVSNLPPEPPPPSSCTEVTVGPLLGGSAQQTTDGAFGSFRTSLFGLGSGNDGLQIEFYTFPGQDGDETGVFDLNLETRYRECSRCVRVFDDFGAPSRTDYIQVGGTLTIDPLSTQLDPANPAFRAQLNDVTLVEHSLFTDELPIMPVPNGRCVYVPSATLEFGEFPLDLPMVVSEHYLSSGLFPDASDQTIGSNCPNRPADARGACYEFTYDENGGTDFAGVIWINGSSFSNDVPLRIMPGATELAFYAWGESGGESIDFSYNIADGGPGNGTTVTLTDVPTLYTIPIIQSYETVEQPFIWGASLGIADPPIRFYVTDIVWQ